MMSKERVIMAINHEETDKIPVDLGSSFETGIHIYTYHELKKALRATTGSIEMIDMLQSLAKVEEDVIDKFNIDVIPLPGIYDALGIRYGVGQKKWTMPRGITCNVSKDFNPIKLCDGSYMIKRGGNTFISPNNGFYFDPVELALHDAESIMDIEKKFSFDEYSKEEIEFYKRETSILMNTDKTVLADIFINFEIEYYFGYEKALMNLIDNKKMMVDFIERLTDMYIRRFTQFKEAVGNSVDILLVAKDLGNQNGPNINPKLVREIFIPCMKKYVSYVKENSDYYVMLHSCGSIYEFIPDIIDCGFDILNPVQINAKNMDPEKLKKEYGKYLCFWGGGVDTQKVLPFGFEKDVREQVRKNAKILSKDGGYVFNPVHNIQANVPVNNIIAAFDEINRFSLS